MRGKSRQDPTLRQVVLPDIREEEPLQTASTGSSSSAHRWHNAFFFPRIRNSVRQLRATKLKEAVRELELACDRETRGLERHQFQRIIRALQSRQGKVFLHSSSGLLDFPSHLRILLIEMDVSPSQENLRREAFVVVGQIGVVHGIRPRLGTDFLSHEEDGSLRKKVFSWPGPR